MWPQPIARPAQADFVTTLPVRLGGTRFNGLESLRRGPLTRWIQTGGDRFALIIMPPEWTHNP